MVIGITGKTNAGKDYICNLLAELDFVELNLDRLGARILDTRKQELQALFANIIKPDGSIDRLLLATLVFKDLQKKAELEELIYPELRRALQRKTAAAPSTNWLLNGALVAEANLTELCDGICWIYAPLLVRVLRALRRDTKNLSKVVLRIKAQRSIRVDSYKNIPLLRLRCFLQTKAALRRSLKKFIIQFI